jgi:hypothetical protein
MGTEAGRPGVSYVIISGSIQPVPFQDYITEEESAGALASSGEESGGLLGYVIISGAIQPVSALGSDSQSEESVGTPAGDEENRSALA